MYDFNKKYHVINVEIPAVKFLGIIIKKAWIKNVIIDCPLGKSCRDRMVESVFQENPLFKRLKVNRGMSEVMTERKYSVGELDDLRRVVENKWLFGCYNHCQQTRISRPYYADERTNAVEDMVRTHMSAGHTAEDLIASEQQS